MIKPVLALLLAVVITLSPIGSALETRMFSHVLIQLPLLVFIGWYMAGFLPTRVTAELRRWNQGGVTGVLIMSAAGIYWMLPSALDSSINYLEYAVAKLGSMVVLIGMVLRLTQQHWNAILKGVFLLEVWAMLGRFGYGYTVSPDRLCTNYLFNEQIFVGQSLLAIAAFWACAWALKIIIGFNLFKLKWES